MPSLTEIKQHLGITSNAYDAFLTEAIDSVTTAAEAYTGSSIKERVIEEYYTPLKSGFELPTASTILVGAKEYGQNSIVLRHRPANAVLDLQVDGTAVSTSDFILEGSVIRSPRLSNYRQAYVKYRCGYPDSSFPAFLKTFIKTGVEKLYLHHISTRQAVDTGSLQLAAGDVKSVSLGDFSVTLSDRSAGSILQDHIESNSFLLERLRTVGL